MSHLNQRTYAARVFRWQRTSAERRRRIPFFNYNVYFDKGDMENEIFQPHRRAALQRGSILCARSSLSHSPNSAEAQSKLIAFDLKRNLPRHLFVSSGAKRGLNATHTQRRRRTMGHYFEYTGYVCATLIAPPLPAHNILWPERDPHSLGPAHIFCCHQSTLQRWQIMFMRLQCSPEWHIVCKVFFILWCFDQICCLAQQWIKHAMWIFLKNVALNWISAFNTKNNDKCKF